MVTLQLRQLVVGPGQRLQFQDVSWSEFNAILDELGEKRSSRVAYSEGFLEIRMPLPAHEVDNELIGDLVKIVLEELAIENECFGSTTFKQEERRKGVEPDQCFYIENAAVMVGKRRVDLAIDPPPDLAIEVDVTSKTGLEAYEGIGVPELWCFEGGQLRISVLIEGSYQGSSTSPHFPSLPVIEWVAEFVSLAQTQGRSQTLRAFRRRVREAIAPHP